MKNHKLLNRCFSGLLAVSMLTSQFTGIMALEHADHDHHVHDETCTLDHEHDLHNHTEEENNPAVDLETSEESEVPSEEVVEKDKIEITAEPEAVKPVLDPVIEIEDIQGPEPVTEPVSDTETQKNEALATPEEHRSFNPADFESDLRKIGLHIREEAKKFTYDYETFDIVVDYKGGDVETIIKNTTEQILDIVFEHTGVSTEGDYLRHHSDISQTTLFTATQDNRLYFSVEISLANIVLKSHHDQVTKELEKIYSTFSADNSPKTKITEIYNWVASNVKKAKNNRATSGGILVNGAYRAVIEKLTDDDGMAVTIYRMLLDHGIDNRIVTGQKGGVSSVWNLVNFDGKYYHCDVFNDVGFTEEFWLSFMKSSAEVEDYQLDSKFLQQDFKQKYPVGTVQTFKPVLENAEFYWNELFDEVQVGLPPDWPFLFAEVVAIPGTRIEPTCFSRGYEEYRAFAEYEGKSKTVQISRDLRKTDHVFELETDWNTETYNVSWTAECIVCQYTAVGITKAEPIRGITQEADCVTPGWGVMMVNIDIYDEDDGRFTTLYDDKGMWVPALGHDYTHKYDLDWEVGSPTAILTDYCRDCDHSETFQVTARKYDEHEATCSWNGSITYAFYGSDPEPLHFYKISIPMNDNHEVVPEMVIDTQKHVGLVSHKCNFCLETTFTTEVQPTVRVLSEATCSTSGRHRYEYTYQWNGQTLKDSEDVVVPVLGHSIKGKVDWSSLNAETSKVKVYYECSTCDFVMDQTVTAVKKANLSKDPTCSKPGNTTYEVKDSIRIGKVDYTVQDQKSFEIPALSHDVVNGTCKICGENFVSFNDIAPNNWYYGHITEAYSRGLMSGTNPAAGEFSPLGTLTRGQVITILYRMAGSPKTAYEPVFTDVKDGLFFSEPIMWAAKAGITTGYTPDANGNVRFGPSDPITREQLAVFLYNFAGLNGKDTSQRANLETMFPDGRYVSVWAKDAMSWLVATGMVEGVAQNGVWTAAPSMKCNRAMMAKLSVMIDDYIAA